MRFLDFERALSRAWRRTFDRQRLLFASVPLVLCGIVFVLCRGLGFHADALGHAYKSHSWASSGLIFLPIFISTAILLAGGVVLVRLYHRELEGKKSQVIPFLVQSWEAVMGASYLAIPLIFLYVLLWIGLGVFYLLLEIPAVGSALGALLAFAPFLLNLASLLLCLLGYLLLFFATPPLALGNKQRFRLIALLVNHLLQRPITAFLTAMCAALPVLICLGVLLLAGQLTGYAFSSGGTPPPLQRMLSWFFEMLPFCALLTPAVSFFFNLSAENYDLLEAMAREETP